MADGRHLEKSKTAISLQCLDRFAQTLARRRILAPQRVRAVKFPTFEYPRWRTAAILRNRKQPCLHNYSTDLHKILHGAAF